jgi:hypothetical protein
VNKYENFLIKNDFLIEIKREDVPLRQMVWFYILNQIITHINK